MEETSWKVKVLGWVIFLVVAAGIYGLSLGIAAVRGGSNPHSDDPCAATYQGPPATCVPAEPTGLP